MSSTDGVVIASDFRRRRRGRTTREGKVFVALTLGVGIAAVNTANNLLYLMLGLMLALVILNMILSEIALYRIAVTRRVPGRAFVGQPCLVEIEIKNHKRRLTSFALSVEDGVVGGRESYRSYFLATPPGRARVASYVFTPQHRGRAEFSPLRVRTRYPFGLFLKSAEFSVVTELVVYPSLTSSISAKAVRGGTEAAGARKRPLNDPGEVALREYRPGDDASAIHWRRSASLRRLIVREHSGHKLPLVSLRLDNRKPTDPRGSWELAFERSISHLAAQAQASLRRGSAVRVVTRDGRSPTVPPGHPADPIWHFLALVEPTSGPPLPP